jgi:hypothetical protein
MYAIRSKLSGLFLMIDIDQVEHGLGEIEVDVELMDSDFHGTIFLTTDRELADRLVEKGEVDSGVSYKKTYIGYRKEKPTDMEVVEFCVKG